MTPETSLPLGGTSSTNSTLADEYNIFHISRKYIPPIRPIGFGAYGIVCSAFNSETGEQVAIKKIGNPFENRIDVQRTLREIKLLCHMDHENVIALKDVICPPERNKIDQVYIAYEFMDTDLHEVIKSNQPLADDHCRHFVYQLLRGLKYIHSANVLHCDLKPMDLFLNVNDGFKIGDFRSARTTSETNHVTESAVNPWYRPPELLLHCSKYTAAVDIWSAGCIMGEIITRVPLFPGRNHSHQLSLITELIGSPDASILGFLQSDDDKSFISQLPQHPRQPFSVKFPNASPLAVDLLEKMLVLDPNRRITVNEALSHPYLASLHDVDDEPSCLHPFRFDFEWTSLTEEDMKEVVWRESLKFNPYL